MKQMMKLAAIFAVCVAMVLSAATVYAGNAVGIVAGDVVNVRSGPSTEHAVVGQLTRGTVADVDGYENGWYHINCNGISGWMIGDYISVREVSDADRYADRSVGQRIAEYAKGFVGTPYVYGGTTPAGFDCSGFTQYVFRQFGYPINRIAADQGSNGLWVARENMTAGDLMLFTSDGCTAINHAGIYVGGGMMVHAAQNGQGVKLSDINTDYYIRNLVVVRRIAY